MNGATFALCYPESAKQLPEIPDMLDRGVVSIEAGDVVIGHADDGVDVVLGYVGNPADCDQLATYLATHPAPSDW